MTHHVESQSMTTADRLSDRRLFLNKLSPDGPSTRGSEEPSRPLNVEARRCESLCRRRLPGRNRPKRAVADEDSEIRASTCAWCLPMRSCGSDVHYWNNCPSSTD